MILLGLREGDKFTKLYAYVVLSVNLGKVTRARIIAARGRLADRLHHLPAIWPMLQIDNAAEFQPDCRDESMAQNFSTE